MSEPAQAATPRQRRALSPAWFLYAAACAVLLFGIVEAVTIKSSTTCDGPYYAQDGTCVSYLQSGDSSIIGSTPTPSTAQPTKDSQLDVRAEILLASLTIALIIASYGARAQQRERVAMDAGPSGRGFA
jgi:hypothetical protein